MTPAINTAKKAKIKFKIHQYDHDPDTKAFGDEAADKLEISSDRIFKTLVVSTETNELALGVIPVSKMLNLKSCAAALDAKKSSLANQKDAERATGYVRGGISPLGQKKRLSTIIDESALNFKTIYVSAGKRGLDIELSPKDLKRLVGGRFASISA
jgi:Cys-tRNA(Pro)/Cys-tRNA(Cys) deacylase